LPWKVDGPEYDIHDGYLLKMPGVIDTNLRIIDRFSKKYRLLSQLVKNPRELTVYENVPKIKPRVETKEPVSITPTIVNASIPDVIDREDSSENTPINFGGF
jgi:hypothetical protein